MGGIKFWQFWHCWPFQKKRYIYSSWRWIQLKIKYIFTQVNFWVWDVCRTTYRCKEHYRKIPCTSDLVSQWTHPSKLHSIYWRWLHEGTEHLHQHKKWNDKGGITQISSKIPTLNSSVLKTSCIRTDSWQAGFMGGKKDSIRGSTSLNSVFSSAIEWFSHILGVTALLCFH